MSRFADRFENLVHEPTQVRNGVVDLTVADVFVVDEPGRVDFGGSELADPVFERHETVKRNPDDEYEWWTLSGGQYLLAYNERLTGDAPVRVQTRRELRRRGAFHPTLVTADLGKMPLSVPTGGIRIKENARVSTVSRLDGE